jgi:hypothetical protein
MHQYSYRLLQPNDDYKQAVIEKAGITADFTLLEVEQMQERNKKGLLEAESQLTIEKAKLTNIERHHPQVKKMSGVLLTAAALYKETQMMVASLEPKIKLIQQAIDENDAMVADVMKQLKDLKPDVKKTVKNRKG